MGTANEIGIYLGGSVLQRILRQSNTVSCVIVKKLE